MAGPKWVTMRNPTTGIAEDVHPGDAAAALQQGWAVETKDEAELRKYQQQNAGSIAEGTKAFGEHALSSATFGVSDFGLSADDPEYRKNRQLRDATFTGIGTVGEAAGFLVPGLGQAKAVGTAGKVAKVVAAPASFVSKVAAKAGGAVERLVAGEAPGAARAILSKAAGGALGGVIEGGVAGAGMALSESSIQDKELTAELLLAHVRDGATIGGVLGGGLSGGIEALALGGKKVLGSGLARKLPGIGDVLEAGAGTRGLQGLAETKALASFGALGGDIKKLVVDGGAEAPHRLGRRILEEAGYEGEGAMGRAMKHDLDDAAQTASSRVKAYDEQLDSVYRRLDESGHRVNVADVLAKVDESVIAPLRGSLYGGDAKLAQMIEGELKPLQAAVRKAEGVTTARELVREFSENVQRLDDTLRMRAPNAPTVLRAVERDAEKLSEHLAEYGMTAEMAELANVRNSLRTAGKTTERGGAVGKQAERLNRARESLGVLSTKVEEAVQREGTPTLSYKDIWDLRKRADKDVDNWTAHQDPRAAAYIGLRNTLKGEIESQAERTGLAKEFVAANSGISDWLAIEKIAKNRSGMVAGNRSVGLTDTLMGSAGGTIGAVLGGGIGGMVGGVAMATGNKLFRSAAGDRLFATSANRYANWRNVTRAADEAAISLSRKTAATVEAVPVKQKAVGLGTRMALQFDQQRERLLERQADHDKLVDELTAQLGDVREIAPGLASATIAAGSRGLNYLQQSLPTAPGYNDLSTQAKRNALDVPDSEKAVWIRRARAVKSPTSILEATKKGTITPDEVQAVKEAYPALHAAMQAQVLDEAGKAAKRGRVPTYQKRLDLSMLAGVPLDATLRPEVISAYQQMHASNAQNSNTQKPLSMASGRAPRYSNRRESFTEREA